MEIHRVWLGGVVFYPGIGGVVEWRRLNSHLCVSFAYRKRWLDTRGQQFINDDDHEQDSKRAVCLFDMTGSGELRS